MLLVPATMELLGARNWWLPRWLDRLLPHLDVEGPSAHGSVPQVPNPPERREPDDHDADDERSGEPAADDDDDPRRARRVRVGV
jgi:hypothetical protein